ncbi:MAG: hypothetical protein EBZ77_09420 [Chitinophagia bacterium]|nr:hypothetical protein [Chitinophagia bacterium]
MSFNINVSSEIGKLNQLMVHRPDSGIENILIDKLHDWLYDDIVDVKKMQHEYDYYLITLLLFLDKKVLFNADGQFDLWQVGFNPGETENYFGIKTDKVMDTQWMLSQLFANDAKNGGWHSTILIERICAMEDVHYTRKLDLLKMYEEGKNNPAMYMEVVKTLLSGKLEWHYNDEKQLVSIKDTPKYIFPLIPNFMFTRDIGVTINSSLLITKPHFRIRKREIVLMRFLSEHILFPGKEERILDVADDDDFFQLEDRFQADYKVNYEGGDIMMISKHHLLLGCSERTSPHAINKLVHRLFKEETDIRLISVIKISPKRSQMHIDTVMSQVKKNVWILFGHLSDEITQNEVYGADYHFSHVDIIRQKSEHDKEREKAVSIFQFYKSYNTDEFYQSINEAPPANEADRWKHHKNRNYFISDEDYKEGSAFKAANPAFNYTKPRSLDHLLRQISVHDYGVASEDQVKILYSGNGKYPHDEREQFTDSCNLLVLREGIAIGYDRNSHTAEAFAEYFHRLNGEAIPEDKKGYIDFLQARYKQQEESDTFSPYVNVEGVPAPPTFVDHYVIHAHDLVDYVYSLHDEEQVTTFIEGLKDTLIVLPSNELSRARGGSHCMSMPLHRNDVN